jgi:hypothetical protein
MHQLLFSSPSRGHRGEPADANIISAHHGKTDHEANLTDSPFCWSMDTQGSRCGHLVKSWSPSGCCARRGRLVHDPFVSGAGPTMCRSLVRSSS